VNVHRVSYAQLIRHPAVRSPLTERPALRARRVGQIIERLQARYPDVQLPLTHQDPYQLLVATILFRAVHRRRG